MHEAYTLAGIALYLGKWALAASGLGVLVATADCILFRWPHLRTRRREWENHFRRDYFRG